MDKKLPIPDYIMKIRQKELLYDEAVERILGTNGIVSAPIAVVKIANSFGFGVYTAVLNHGGYRYYKCHGRFGYTSVNISRAARNYCECRDQSC